jgi:two-component system chemotaxis response regulator CheB
MLRKTSSVAAAAGPNALGILLTGMGNDGASGMLEMKRAGGRTVAQDENSCVVFGMPKEAIAMGAVDCIVPLSGIAAMILSWTRREKLEPPPTPGFTKTL